MCSPMRFPRFFPGWHPASYWLVAVAVTDSLAEQLHMSLGFRVQDGRQAESDLVGVIISRKRSES